MNRYEDRSASEETEDLGFLSTQVYETLTSGKEEPKAPMSETQVLETMTRRGEEAKEAPEEAEETTAPADDEPVQEEAKKPSGIVIGAIAAGVAVLGGVIALLARPKRSPEKKEDEPEQKGEPEDE